MRLRNKLQLIIPLFVLVACCGCGVNPTEQGKAVGEASPAPTVSPVSVDSVDYAVFKNSEDTVKEKRLENDFMRVYVNSDDILILESLDGTDQKKITIKNLYAPFWLTNEWLYYAIGEGVTGVKVFYRTPVNRDNDRGTVDISKKEKLFQGESVTYDDFMLTDSYILYPSQIPNEDDSDGQDEDDSASYPFFRYNLETGKSTRVKGLNGHCQKIVREAVTGLPVLLGESFFMIDYYKEKTYRVSVDTLKKEVFFADGVIVDTPGAMTEYQGNLYFFSTGKKDGLWKYDGDSGEHTCLLSEQKLEEIIDSMGLWLAKDEDKTIHLETLGICQNRIYLSVYMMCDKDVNPQNITCIYIPEHERDILLSAELSDTSQWELEEKVMAYMLDKDYKHEVHEGMKSYIHQIYDGTVYIYILGVEGEHPALYHISTGEMEELKRTDYRFWENPLYYWR